MFTEEDLQLAGRFCKGLKKQASTFVNPHDFDAYSLGMPALKPWASPAPTYGSAFKGMFSGLGKAIGTGAQTVLTGKNNPGVMENLLGNGIKLMAHPTDPAYFRGLLSARNFTAPFDRARPQFNEATQEMGEFPGMIRHELGGRYNVLKGLFNGPPGH